MFQHIGKNMFHTDQPSAGLATTFSRYVLTHLYPLYVQSFSAGMT